MKQESRKFKGFDPEKIIGPDGAKMEWINEAFDLDDPELQKIKEEIYEETVTDDGRCMVDRIKAVLSRHQDNLLHQLYIMFLFGDLMCLSKCEWMRRRKLKPSSG